VHVADGAKDPQQVELHDRLAVAQLLRDAPEELRFGDADRDRSRETTDLEEGIQQILERACFGRDETLEKCVEGLWFGQLVLNTRCLLL